MPYHSLPMDAFRLDGGAYAMGPWSTATPSHTKWDEHLCGSRAALDQFTGAQYDYDTFETFAERFVSDLFAGASLRNLLREATRGYSWIVTAPKTYPEKAPVAWLTPAVERFPRWFSAYEDPLSHYWLIGDGQHRTVASVWSSAADFAELLLLRRKVDVDVLLARFGAAAIVKSLMAAWGTRHDFTHQSSKPDTKLSSRAYFSCERALALFRFARGFFGAHKVDARNNP